MKTIIFLTCIITQIAVHSQPTTENSDSKPLIEDFSNWTDYFSNYALTFDILSTDQFLITLPNIKTITEENHQKYFERLKTIYPEIHKITFDKSNNKFQILLETPNLTFDQTVAILRQFGVKQNE